LNLTDSPSRRRRAISRNGGNANSALAAANAAPMSMTQVLASLTSKARLEAEEAQRVLLAALNGLAGASALSGQAAAARETYRRALRTLRANVAEAGVRADPLQRLHALTNLKALLRNATNDNGLLLCDGGDAESDDGDVDAEASEIRDGYLAQWHARLAAAEAEYEKAVEAVEKELLKAANGGFDVEEEGGDEEGGGRKEGAAEEQEAPPAAAAVAGPSSSSRGKKRPARAPPSAPASAAAAAAASQPAKKKQKQTKAGAKTTKTDPISRLSGAEHGGTSEAAGSWFLTAIDTLQVRGDEAASRSLFRLREELEQSDRYEANVEDSLSPSQQQQQQQLLARFLSLSPLSVSFEFFLFPASFSFFLLFFRPPQKLTSSSSPSSSSSTITKKKKQVPRPGVTQRDEPRREAFPLRRRRRFRRRERDPREAEAAAGRRARPGLQGARGSSEEARGAQAPRRGGE